MAETKRGYFNRLALSVCDKIVYFLVSVTRKIGELLVQRPVDHLTDLRFV